MRYAIAIMDATMFTSSFAIKYQQENTPVRICETGVLRKMPSGAVFVSGARPA